MVEFICESCGYEGTPLAAVTCPICGAKMIQTADLGNYPAIEDDSELDDGAVVLGGDFDNESDEDGFDSVDSAKTKPAKKEDDDEL